MQDLIDIVEGFKTPSIALVGDFMLDRYVFGDAERISPEAPVPVLRAVRSESRTGGAGNVAAGICALGGKAVCIGIRGADDAGDEMTAMLKDLGADVRSMIQMNSRPTTVKTRYIGLAQHRHAQQLFRVDTESSEPLSQKIGSQLTAAVRSQIQNCTVLAVEDYDKGLLTDANTPEIIAAARDAGKAVVVDPARISDYRRYRGATLLTPNRYEAQLASGVSIIDDGSLLRAARQILMVTDADAVAVTLDREGIFLCPKESESCRIPTRPRTIYDVSGAGDVVVAALAVALAEGASMEQAAALANIAGGLEVEHVGFVPVSRREMLDELRHLVGLRGAKVVCRKKLADEIARRRQLDEKIVFTNGCFDLLHLGHVRTFQQARELGSCLVVAINSDASVQRLKGPARPVINQDERSEMIASLECVDYVTIYDEDTPEALLKLLKPDVLAKGGTTPEVVGRDLVEGYGGEVVTLELVEGLSTTKIIGRIISGHDQAT